MVPASEQHSLRLSIGSLCRAGFGRSGVSLKAPDELVRVQRNSTRCRVATTSATQHAPGEGYPTASVADGRRAIRNSSAACSTPHFRARRREHARGASVTRTELIRRCAALDSSLVRGAGPRSCSLSRATRRNRAAPDAGNRDHQCRSRTNTATVARAHGVPGGANQRAGTWHEPRGSSARHWPMTHGRDRGAAEAANSARHGSGCNLPAHHQRSGGVGSTHAQPCIRSRRVDGRQACRYEIGLEAGVAPGPLHQKPAALLPALESAHSLLTAIGGGCAPWAKTANTRC